MLYKALINSKSNVFHLYIYDCQVYLLNKYIPHLDKLRLKAFIKYLTDYDLINIY